MSEKGYYDNSLESWLNSPLENMNTSQTNIHSKNLKMKDNWAL